jgi:branched-subunit amino acid aminotransferase/4-amino-4-deoxychorismate lyase
MRGEQEQGQQKQRQQVWQWDPGAREWVDNDRVPVSDRGFRYGMALFETALIYRRAPVLLRDHITQMFSYADSLQWPLPTGALLGIPSYLKQRREHLPEHGILRIHLTAGDGLFGARPGQPRLLVSCHAGAPPKPLEQCRPLRVTARTLSHTQGFPNAFGFKSHNYWHNLQMRTYAALFGCDEALISGNDGSVSSFSRGNLFLVRGSRLITSPLSSGARPGVVRNWLMDRYVVEHDEPLTLDDLFNADEMFLTNSGVGIWPAASLSGRRYYATSKGSAIAARWREFLDSLVE